MNTVTTIGVRAILRGLDVERYGAGWQDIATAPRDPSILVDLVCRSDFEHDPYPVRACRYAGGPDGWPAWERDGWPVTFRRDRASGAMIPCNDSTATQRAVAWRISGGTP